MQSSVAIIIWGGYVSLKCTILVADEIEMWEAHITRGNRLMVATPGIFVSNSQDWCNNFKGDKEKLRPLHMWP